MDAIENGLAHHDCAALQDILPGVAFCNFSEFSEMSKMPPEMLKVFRLAQLTIRYLLQSQDMLTEALQKLNTDNDITHQVWQNCPKKVAASSHAPNSQYNVLHWMIGTGENVKEEPDGTNAIESFESRV